MRANYKVELASGIFLLLGIAALAWLATTATDYGQEIGKDTYSVTARFQNIGDLRVRAPVKIGGVTIGMVESIELDPVSFEAVVTMNLAMQFNEIPSDTGASILTSGLLGAQFVGLEPGGEDGGWYQQVPLVSYQLADGSTVAPSRVGAGSADESGVSLGCGVSPGASVLVG